MQIEANNSVDIEPPASHWVPHSYGLVPHLSKKLSKLLEPPAFGDCQFLADVT